jgi:hypothetical protein
MVFAPVFFMRLSQLKDQGQYQGNQAVSGLSDWHLGHLTVMVASKK